MDTTSKINNNAYNQIDTSPSAWYFFAGLYFLRPFLEENIFMPQYQYEQRKATRLPIRLSNPLYGREELDLKLQKLASNAPGIERVWEITKNLPSLTNFLDDNNDE